MAKIIKPISVDVARENTYIYILAKQGDAVSRYLEIEMQNEGEPIDITGATSATLTAVKSDNTVTLTQGTITGGKVTVELTKQTLAIDGPVHCYLSVVAGGSILSTLDFTISVQATNVDEDKIISSDEYTAFQVALAAIGDINTLRNDVDKAKQDAEKSATVAAKSANDAAAAVEEAMGDILPIETEDIADAAVTVDKLADGGITPGKTSFVSSATTGEASSIASTTSDNGDKVWILTDLSRQYYCFDSAWDSGVTCKIMDYRDATEPDTDATTVTYNGRTYRALTITGTAPKITMDMSSEGFVQEFSVIYFSGLVIPDLVVSTDNLADAAVTMPKLSAEVREALSGALKRKIVSALPSSDGEVLTAKKSAVSAQNKSKDGDLISVNWVALDNAANVAPIASTKRLRFTLTLTKASGTGSYRGGQARLRKWRNNVETVATYNLPGAKVVDGSVAWDIPLTSFEASDTAIWADVNQIMVYVYANNSATPADGEYTLTISDVRIVDTAVQSDLDLQTIYMVPSDDPQTENAYDEYMYIGSAWERIGSTAMDLSDYYTSREIDALISGTDCVIHNVSSRVDPWDGQSLYDADMDMYYYPNSDGKTVTLGNKDNGSANGGGDVISGAMVLPDFLWYGDEGKLYRVAKIANGALYNLTAQHISDNSTQEQVVDRLYLPRGLTYDGGSLYNYEAQNPNYRCEVIARSSNVKYTGLASCYHVYYGDDSWARAQSDKLETEVTAVDTKVGDIDTALDSIIAIQTSLMGGDA